MPKNTKVYRCVHSLKKKMEIGKAIAICQKSTKLNYRTGKKLKLKKQENIYVKHIKHINVKIKNESTKIFRNKTYSYSKKK